jgi:hypothetical protein
LEGGVLSHRDSILLYFQTQTDLWEVPRTSPFHDTQPCLLWSPDPLSVILKQYELWHIS